MTQITSRKVTISLPEDLLTFADSRASDQGMTRSRVIGRALEELRRREQDQLAIKGYRFYARESREFAEQPPKPFLRSLMTVRRGEIYWAEFSPVKGAMCRELCSVDHRPPVRS